MFVIEGEIELTVNNRQNTESCMLDILKSGDTIGQFSVLKQKGFLINGTATKESRVYYLDSDFLTNYKEKIEGLCGALNHGIELMKGKGVPIEDYTIH